MEKKKKNPFKEDLFLVGHRGTANIMSHILQVIDLFEVYSPERILTSSEAIVGKGSLVWLIFSYL